jgi:hypothetical protein
MCGHLRGKRNIYKVLGVEIMESKTIVRKFLSESEDQSDRYISSGYDDWSDDTGPGIDGFFKLHDGKNSVVFYFVASSDEEFDRSLQELNEIEAQLAVLQRELRMAYMDAKIRSANAKSENESKAGLPPSEED